ncbi:MAG: alpha/beta hydrolase [Flavobacteriales bacterium]|nr:alpha/beta hydrolase [Flavobacteriales bacterium]
MEWVLGILVLLCLAYAGVCLFYALFQERFIFIRFRTPRKFRYRFKGAFDERFIIASDGAELHGLYFKAKNSRGVVIYFHGNTGSLRRWGKHAPQFTDLGYDVLMPDPRGYGKSRGEINEPVLHSDAELWYTHLRERWSESDIVVFGRSLGSGLATPLASKFSPKVLMLETPFANLYDVAMHYLPILPYRLLLRYPFRNDIAIKRIKCPVYVLHGKRDNVVPYGSALRLYSLIPSNVHREMITFPRGHHSDLARSPRYHKLLKRVLA